MDPQKKKVKDQWNNIKPLGPRRSKMDFEFPFEDIAVVDEVHTYMVQDR